MDKQTRIEAIERIITLKTSALIDEDDIQDPRRVCIPNYVATAIEEAIGVDGKKLIEIIKKTMGYCQIHNIAEEATEDEISEALASSINEWLELRKGEK